MRNFAVLKKPTRGPVTNGLTTTNRMNITIRHNGNFVSATIRVTRDREAVTSALMPPVKVVALTRRDSIQKVRSARDSFSFRANASTQQAHQRLIYLRPDVTEIQKSARADQFCKLVITEIPHRIRHRATKKLKKNNAGLVNVTCW